MDFVLIWVDGNDPEWRIEYNKYAADTKGDKSEIRFRDWDNLQYWFRGVEKFAPWVDKIHFVTCGHLPKWLNVNAPKLNIVKHSDYIPAQYLPTFNSHTIELNLHRIEGLSEEFVYFNDDLFIIDTVRPEHFFRRKLPCDMAVLNTISTSSIAHILLNNVRCINRNFQKNEVLKESFGKWYNLKYGFSLYRTLALMAWTSFTGFYDPHLPNAFLKSTFSDVWSKEPDMLDATCRSRFREDTNVSQYLMRYWQLASSNFYPLNVCKNTGCYDLQESDFDNILGVINNQEKSVIVLNDAAVTDFEYKKEALNEAFEKILPDKSIYEI